MMFKNMEVKRFEDGVFVNAFSLGLSEKEVKEYLKEQNKGVDFDSEEIETVYLNKAKTINMLKKITGQDDTIINKFANEYQEKVYEVLDVKIADDEEVKYLFCNENQVFTECIEYDSIFYFNAPQVLGGELLETIKYLDQDEILFIQSLNDRMNKREIREDNIFIEGEKVLDLIEIISDGMTDNVLYETFESDLNNFYTLNKNIKELENTKEREYCLEDLSIEDKIIIGERYLLLTKKIDDSYKAIKDILKIENTYLKRLINNNTVLNSYPFNKKFVEDKQSYNRDYAIARTKKRLNEQREIYLYNINMCENEYKTSISKTIPMAKNQLDLIEKGLYNLNQLKDEYIDKKIFEEVLNSSVVKNNKININGNTYITKKGILYILKVLG